MKARLTLFQSKLTQRRDSAESFASVLEKKRGMKRKGFGESLWCARRDSNSRPNAPEAFALSS